MSGQKTSSNLTWKIHKTYSVTLFWSDNQLTQIQGDEQLSQSDGNKVKKHYNALMIYEK